MSGDSFDDHSTGEAGTSTSLAEFMDTAEQPTMHGAAPRQRIIRLSVIVLRLRNAEFFLILKNS